MIFQGLVSLRDVKISIVKMIHAEFLFPLFLIRILPTVFEHLNELVEPIYHLFIAT